MNGNAPAKPRLSLDTLILGGYRVELSLKPPHGLGVRAVLKWNTATVMTRDGLTMAEAVENLERDFNAG
jgi:hypothetical protein